MTPVISAGILHRSVSFKIVTLSNFTEKSMNTLKSTPPANTAAPTTTANDTGAEVSQLPSKPPSKQAVLKEQLAAEIRSRMEVLPDDPNNPEDIIKPYTMSLQTLKKMWDELQHIIPSLCAANMMNRDVGGDVPEKKREEGITSLHQRLVESTSFNIPQPESIIRADVLAWDIHEMTELLRESIDSNITSFVDGFFKALNALVDQNAAGLANWTSPTTLQYSYYHHIVEQFASENRTDTESTDRGHTVTEYRKTIVPGRDTYLLAMHEHHVFNAHETTVEKSSVVVPLVVQSYLDGVPDWLLPIHRIIGGTIANKEVREKEYWTESWEETIAEEVIVFGPDPALAIGDVVLTGWDTDDIQRELDRREDVAATNLVAWQKRQARWLSPLFVIVTLSIAVLPLTLFLQTTSSMQLWAACAALFLVIPPGILQTLYRDRVRGTESRTVIRALSLVSMLLAAGLGIVGFRLRQWPGIAIAALLLAIGFTLIRFSQVRDARSNAVEGR